MTVEGTPHEPTPAELDDLFSPAERARAEAEFRRVMSIEDHERLGHVVLAVIEGQLSLEDI